ncbi:MAG: glycosyltransferase [Acidimicrobiales bacterium]
MPTLSATDLTVVIPTRDRWEILARTVTALSHQTVGGFETLVVVDGSDQSPPDLVGVQVVVQEHAGPGVARNTGVGHSDRPIVLFLGDDMVPDPTLVERHLRAHALHRAPEDAVLGHVIWHPEVPLNRIVRWLEWSGTQFDYPNITTPDAGWGRFYSCNVSLKRDFFLQCGGFDPDFEFDYEDLDLGYRLGQQGLALWYEPEAIARHLHRYDFDRLARRYASHARGERIMAAKHTWFTPFFSGLVQGALDHGRVSPTWLALADLPPSVFGPLSALARRQTSTWFLRQLAPYFLSAWEGEDDLTDLRTYLGEEFDTTLLHCHQQAVDREELAAADEDAFYRTSRMYLYDLTAFAMTPTKRPYLAALRACIPAGGSVLDYGCGIGSDGLRLLESGYQVAFADFDNPSTAYLRWRLERRGSDAPVYDLTQQVPGGFDAAFAFDVIEHVEDPIRFLEELETRARVVAVNFLEPAPGDTHLHKALPITSLVDRATRRGLLHYRRYHGRSHLVIYRADRAGDAGITRSFARRARGELALRSEFLATAVRRRIRG